MPAIERDLVDDRIDVLFVSAQRFANEDFTTRLLPSIQRSIGMFVVDEAHCISDWGHEFVPDYLRISLIWPRQSARNGHPGSGFWPPPRRPRQRPTRGVALIP